MMSPVLRIQNLETVLHTETTSVRAVDGLTLEIGKSETFALLGESGCGNGGRAETAAGSGDFQ